MKTAKFRTAAAIAAELEKMETAADGLAKERSEAESTRADLLRTATVAEIEAHDERLRRNEIEQEKAQAALVALRLDLALAHGRERIDEVEALQTDARATHEKFTDFWFNRYPDLARAIAAGLELEKRAGASRRAAQAAFERLAHDPDVEAAGGIRPVDLPPIPSAFFNSHVIGFPSYRIALPAVEPGPAFAWPRNN